MKNEDEYENNKTTKTKEDTGLEEFTKETDFGESEETKSKQELDENNPSSSDEKSKEDTNESSLASESDKQNDELEKIKEENSALKEKYTRLLAEFENFRKRNDKERLSMIDIGASEVLTKLLPIVDNFDRAIESINTITENTKDGTETSEEEKSKQEESFTKGIEQIYKQLQKFLEDLNVKKIKALGEQFDPNMHNAVMTDEESDAQEGTITADLQPGYTYKDQILRHSMVKVKK